MSIQNLFEQDAEAFKVADTSLSSVSALGRKAKSLEKEIEEQEALLKSIKEQYRKLTEETIPEAMTELGMKKFTMDDGSEVSIKPFNSASISGTQRALRSVRRTFASSGKSLTRSNMHVYASRA